MQTRLRLRATSDFDRRLESGRGLGDFVSGILKQQNNRQEGLMYHIQQVPEPDITSNE